MGERSIIYQRIADLSSAKRNPRTHSKKQIDQIAESIKQFRFTNPILVDANGRIIAGHGRVKAAQLLGLEQVPTIRLDHLSEAEIRAYVIADNRLAENAGWDKELLALELQYLSELDVDFDLTVTGFEADDIEILIESVEATDDDPEADVIPESVPRSLPITRVGDLWCLGRHRLLCADARDAGAFDRLMPGRTAQMVFIDPPYNVPIDGHVCGSGAIKHSEFVMASGEMSEAEFIGFLEACLGHLAQHSAEGSIHYVCMDWRHAYELLTAGRETYTELKNLCVWTKDNAGMGSFYRSKHELVFVFKHGTAPHINNFRLGELGRHRSNVWDYAGVNSLGPGRLEELAMHPTVKPVALVADAMRDCSKRDGIVLDSFVGSGTSIIAAEKTERVGYAMELDPRHVDTAIRRWETYAGREAVHADDGRTFGQVAAARASNTEPKRGKAKRSPRERGSAAKEARLDRFDS